MIALAERPIAAKRLQVREATIADVFTLAANMREADTALAAKIGRDPKAALRQSYKQSRIYRRVALIDGEIMVMWGVSGDILADVGFPWMITARGAARHRLLLLALGRHELTVMRRLRRVLVDYVAPEDYRAARFLGFLGFRYAGEGPHMVGTGPAWSRYELRSV